MNRKPLFAVGAVLSITLVVGGAVILAGRPSPVCAANAVVSFNDDILPIFKGRCIDCHQSGGVGYEKSGLDLRTYAGVMKGTKFGSMLMPIDGTERRRKGKVSLQHRDEKQHRGRSPDRSAKEKGTETIAEDRGSAISPKRFGGGGHSLSLAHFPICGI